MRRDRLGVLKRDRRLGSHASGHGSRVDPAQALLRLNEEVVRVLRRLLPMLVPAAGDRERREHEDGASACRRRG